MYSLAHAGSGLTSKLAFIWKVVLTSKLHTHKHASLETRVGGPATSLHSSTEYKYPLLLSFWARSFPSARRALSLLGFVYYCSRWMENTADRGTSTPLTSVRAFPPANSYEEPKGFHQEARGLVMSRTNCGINSRVPSASVLPPPPPKPSPWASLRPRPAAASSRVRW
jgi:hypothetical protein